MTSKIWKQKITFSDGSVFINFCMAGSIEDAENITRSSFDFITDKAKFETIDAENQNTDDFLRGRITD